MPECFDWGILAPPDGQLNQQKTAQIDRAAFDAHEQLERRFLTCTPLQEQVLDQECSQGAQRIPSAEEVVPDRESESGFNDSTQKSEEVEEDVIPDRQNTRSGSCGIDTRAL